MVTIQREHDFCYFRSLFKNSIPGGTSEVSPVKFWGIGRSVFVLSTGASALGVGVGTQNGAVSFFSILVFDPEVNTVLMRSWNVFAIFIVIFDEF